LPTEGLEVLDDGGEEIIDDGGEEVIDDGEEDDIAPECNDGLPCDDGNACTVGDTCQSDVCTGGTPPDCSEAGDQCNTASCDAAGLEGNCNTLTPVTDGTACDDGNACTVGETCQNGLCTGGASPDCSEAGDQCNTASCDAAGLEGNCNTLTPVTDGTACDDGNVCNVGETCQSGVCTGGAPPDCSDASCDPEGLEGNCDTPTPEDPPVTEQTVTIEPDDYVDGTDLTHISPHVTLWTADNENRVVSLFFVSASDDGQGLAPTGNRVFGHANIPFFNTNRRLLLVFSAPTRSVSIMFAGGTFHDTEIGRLQVFDASNQLLAEYVTEPREAGENELMTVTRATADIAWALAYVAEDEGSFGRLDQLSFTFEGP
jgi:hypothetical protein